MHFWLCNSENSTSEDAGNLRMRTFTKRGGAKSALALSDEDTQGRGPDVPPGGSDKRSLVCRVEGFGSRDS